jgi:hypothetical protein
MLFNQLLQFPHPRLLSYTQARILPKRCTRRGKLTREGLLLDNGYGHLYSAFLDTPIRLSINELR